MANLDKQHALGTAKESLLYVRYPLYSCQMELLIELFSCFILFLTKRGGRKESARKKKGKSASLSAFDLEREHSLVVGAVIWQ